MRIISLCFQLKIDDKKPQRADSKFKVKNNELPPEVGLFITHSINHARQMKL
jgi:hypothetical protein